LGNYSSKKGSSTEEEESAKHLEEENCAQIYVLVHATTLLQRKFKGIRKATLSPADVANISPVIKSSSWIRAKWWPFKSWNLPVNSPYPIVVKVVKT
jgi:hypothetical protein